MNYLRLVGLLISQAQRAAILPFAFLCHLPKPQIFIKYVPSFWQRFGVNKAPAPTSLTGIYWRLSELVIAVTLQSDKEPFIQQGIPPKSVVSLSDLTTMLCISLIP